MIHSAFHIQRYKKERVLTIKNVGDKNNKREEYDMSYSLSNGRKTSAW